MSTSIVIYLILGFLFLLEISWILRIKPAARWQTIRQLLPINIGAVVMMLGFIANQPLLAVLGGIAGIAIAIVQSSLRFPGSYQAAFKRYFIGDMNGALELIDKFIQAHPQSCEAYTLRSLIHLALGESVKAEHDAEKVKQLKPNSSMSFGAFGQIFYFQGHYSEAKEAFSQALELGPGLEPNLSNLGQACYRLGEYEAAIEYLKAASLMRTTTASNLLTHYYLGRSFEELGRRDQAAKVFGTLRRFRTGSKELNKHFDGWSKGYPEMHLIQDDLANIEELVS